MTSMLGSSSLHAACAVTWNAGTLIRLCMTSTAQVAPQCKRVWQRAWQNDFRGIDSASLGSQVRLLWYAVACSVSMDASVWKPVGNNRKVLCLALNTGSRTPPCLNSTCNGPQSMSLSMLAKRWHAGLCICMPLSAVCKPRVSQQGVSSACPV